MFIHTAVCTNAGKASGQRAGWGQAVEGTQAGALVILCVVFPQLPKVDMSLHCRPAKLRAERGSWGSGGSDRNILQGQPAREEPVSMARR